MLRFLSILSLLVCCLQPTLWARISDSPLTSTPIHQAYLDVPMVQMALQAKVVNQQIFDFLVNKKSPLDQRVAVVSALGWNIDGQQNLQPFRQMLRKRFGSEFDPISEGYNRPDLMLIWAYLMAMDNYFDVREAVNIAAQASEYLYNSQAGMLVITLIRSQDDMDRDWCYVWRNWTQLSDDWASLKKDKVRKDAYAIVGDYLGLYGDGCR
jgi:hypothetical protein